MDKKIYIASSLKNYQQVLNIRDKLANHGIWLTYDWAEIIKENTEKGIKESKDNWLEIACTEYIAVLDAQLFFLVCPAGRGGHFELGVAYAKNIPIVILDDNDPIAFYEMPDIQDRFKDEDQAISRIVEMVG
jgi:hypothetical protein